MFEKLLCTRNSYGQLRFASLQHQNIVYNKNLYFYSFFDYNCVANSIKSFFLLSIIECF
jgi:hypothetical protein